MSEETSGEKTFAPTEKRLKDAAEKGDVLRSKDLGTAGVILLAGGWFALAGPWLFGDMARLMREAFQFDAGEVAGFAADDLLMDGLMLALPIIVSLALPVILVTLLTQLAFGRGRFVTKNLAFKGSRINPLAGLKRMFGPNGLIEAGKGLLKVVLLGGIALVWWRASVEELMALGQGSLSGQLTIAWHAFLTLLFALAGGLVVIALIDLPIQWLRQNKRLKMSYQDMKDENKESEGSPEARAAQRQRQRDIARGSVQGAMREAQFIVTNPTHFAIALTYDQLKAPAPLLLAKGRGEKALAMRELAREFDLPVLEYPQLARSLYYTGRERQMICEDLYAAVASVLAYVLSLKRGELPPMPRVEVPVAIRFDADGRLTP